MKKGIGAFNLSKLRTNFLAASIQNPALLHLTPLNRAFQRLLYFWKAIPLFQV